MSIIPGGIYAPVLSFFHDSVDEAIDVSTAAQHVIRLANAGLAGVVLHGSTGEPVHLTPTERSSFIRACRVALDSQNFGDFKIIAGCGCQSYNETLSLIRDSAAAGADAAIVLPPGYYADQMSNDDVVIPYFRRLATESPVPILLYNFPGVTNGVDLSAQTLVKLSSHPNIVGCKLACGDVGKMTFLSEYAGNLRPATGDFKVFAGSTDFAVAAYAAGAAGAITTIANLFPYTIVALWKALGAGNLSRARRLQAIVTRAEISINAGFIPATRAVLRYTSGYGGKSRSPLFEIPDDSLASDTSEILNLEKTLASGRSAL